MVLSAHASEPHSRPIPGDDATYRPTVRVRQGHSIGTGTIIASVEGETLILTASHVVEDSGPLFVELFRFNLGWERYQTVSGFPRRLAATVAARDRDADLAVLRVGGQLALPYVVRIAPSSRSIPAGTPVTSIGFDHGEGLIGFPSKVRRVDRVDMDRGGGDRPFLITDNPPEVGRSGGGLFLADGTLVGVCVARAQLRPGPLFGMYSSVGNVEHLIQSHQKLARVVAESHPVVAAARPASKPVPKAGTAQINRTGEQIRAN